MTGSGYLLDDGLVLTAAHVIGADNVTGVSPLVQFVGSADRLACAVEWYRFESERPRGARMDAAILRIVDPTWQPIVDLPPLRWGRLVTDRANIPVRLNGFPTAMDARDEQGKLIIRDMARLSGVVDAGTSVKGRRYHVTVHHPLPSSATAADSRWEGLSGAVVTCHGVVVGVTAEARSEPDWAWMSVVPTPELLAEPGFRDLVGSVVAEPAELQPVLEQSGVRQAHSPVSLLRAQNEVVGFDQERDGMIDRLQAWCTDEGWFSVRLVTGAGGQGKTRLAARLVAVMRELNWSCGFLDSQAARPDLDVVGDLTTPSLLVIDYAETRAGQLVELLDVVDRRARGSDGTGRISGVPAVRVLLLARAGGDWWEETRTDSLLLRDLGSGTVVDLPDLYPAERRPTALRTVVSDLALALGDVPGYAGAYDQDVLRSLPLPNVADSRFGRALDLHMAVLVTLLQAIAPVPADEPGEPDEAVLLRHEQRFWKLVAVRFGLGELSLSARRQLVAVATLCVARDTTRAANILARLTSLSDQTDDDRARIAHWLAALYPSDRDFWSPLRPDRIGEYLVGLALSDIPDLLDQLLPTSGPDESVGALQVLARAASHQAHVSAPLQQVIADNPAALAPVAVVAATSVEHPEPLRAALVTVVGEGNDDLALLDRIYHEVPSQSQTLAVWAAELAGRIAELVGADIEAGGTKAFPDLAAALNNHAYRLNAAGHPELALPRNAMAVRLYEELVRHSPGKYDADLSTSVEGYAQQLYLLGRRVEAASTAERAVDLRRQHADSDENRRLLADVLTGYGNHLSATGEYEPAVVTTRESVDIYSRLPASVRESHDRGFAAALVAHAIALHEIGRIDDSVSAMRKAVTLYRTLASRFPDAHRPGLAATLSNLAEMLGESGELDLALACAQESVALHEKLVSALPDAHLPNHAAALHCAASCLANLARWTESAQCADEAAALFERVARTETGEYVLELGTALDMYALALSECDRTDDAVRVWLRAIAVLRPLATDDDIWPSRYSSGSLCATTPRCCAK
jgi:tetratricopeptide (TPR) repeat protein